MAKYSIDVIKKAKDLYLEDFSIRKITEQLGIKSHLTVFTWSKKYNWKKARPSYPVNSLKEQLNQCTDIVNTIRPKLKEVNVLNPTKEGRELLINYNRFSNLQLKLVRQLSGLKIVDNKSSKKNIFL